MSTHKIYYAVSDILYNSFKSLCADLYSTGVSW